MLNGKAGWAVLTIITPLGGIARMSKKIATVITVFAACDKLDAANERWNREDVRTEIGGGGYVVIDPLIRASRCLKPLRELAPTTPTELLHQVAESLEANYASCIGSVEERLAERRSIFDAIVSERLAGLEHDLQAREAALQAVEQNRSDLAGHLEKYMQALGERQQSSARLQSENDGPRGQGTRLEGEHKEAVERLRTEGREQVQHRE
jgi:hypothetical protein